MSPATSEVDARPKAAERDCDVLFPDVLNHQLKPMILVFTLALILLVVLTLARLD